MATATATNPSLLKTLSASNTSFTTSLHIQSSIFNPKSVSFSKPIKLPSLFLQKQTRFISFVAQTTSDWDQQEGSSAALDEQEEPSTWDEAEAEVQGEEEAFPEPPEDAKLFVANLPFDVDSESLAQLFQAAGIVEISEVIYNRRTGSSRGFGFVTMSTVEEAEKAVDMFNGHELNGRTLTVNKAGPRGARPERPPRDFQPSFRIYVGNLPWDVDDARLEEVFSEHGKVLNARVVADSETGRSRGFGFVIMASEAEMYDAISALDGQTLDGRAIKVNVAKDRPRRSF